MPGITIVAIRSVRQTLGVPPSADEHLVHRLGQMAEGHLLAEHGPEAAGVRQRADQHERRLAPRGDRQLQPVPLDLLAGRVIDLDRRRRRRARCWQTRQTGRSSSRRSSRTSVG